MDEEERGDEAVYPRIGGDLPDDSEQESFGHRLGTYLGGGGTSAAESGGEDGRIVA